MLHQISLAIVKAIKTRKIPSPWFNPYNIFKECVILFMVVCSYLKGMITTMMEI